MSLWRGSQPLVLASRSAARRALLDAAGLAVDVIEVPVDERAVERAASAAEAGPDDIARVLARAKALAGSRAAGRDRLVLGADQTLALAGVMFHKVRDRAGARAQLARLAGRTHVLHAGVALARDEQIVFETVSTARLTLRALDADEIETYLDAAGPSVFDSVGCYQIEALGVHLIEAIEGDHFTILGLPLLALLAFLRTEGLVP